MLASSSFNYRTLIMFYYLMRRVLPHNLISLKLSWQFSLNFFFHMNIYHHLFLFFINSPPDPEWTYSPLVCELGRG